jgi:hypothetical protein
VLCAAAVVFTFSSAQDAYGVTTTTTGKERAAAQLRNQAANLETRADQLEEPEEPVHN